MKIPLFSKLTAKSRGRKVVRASARAMRGGEDDYYEAEPNMKLSHAFMVVLILHIVAVGVELIHPVAVRFDVELLFGKLLRFLRFLTDDHGHFHAAHVGHGFFQAGLFYLGR